MAVAHSAASESHTGTTGSANQASFNWTHTQTGTPQGVVVFVHTNGSTNLISSVTYGTVTLTAVSGGSAVDTAGEPCRTDVYFAGSGLGTGNQTITVNRTNNATVMYATAATVTAGANTAIPTATIVLLEGDGTLAEQSVDDTSSGQNSVRYAGITSGLNNVPATGASSTLLHSIDYGNNYTAALVRETTAGQGSRSVGFSSGTTDDRAAVHLAIRELVPRTETPIVGAFTLTGGAPTLTKASPKQMDGGTGAFTLTGNSADLRHNSELNPVRGAFTETGNDAAVTHGYKLTADTGSYGLTGNDATLNAAAAVTLDAAVGTFALTGNPATPVRSYSLAAEAGTFALTGNAATLADTDQLDAATGIFALTGGSPVLVRTYYLSGGTGTFTETGQPATLTRTYTTAVTAGTFALTGNPVTLTYATADELAAIAGSFTLTGNPATFTAKTPAELGAATGAFVLTGGNTSFNIGRLFAPETGLFVFTGLAAAYQRTYVLSSESGLFSFTGHPAALAQGQTFSVTTGTYVFTGEPVTFGIFANYKLFPNLRTYDLTGNPANTAHSRIYTVNLGSYTLTGNPIAITYDQRRRVILIF